MCGTNGGKETGVWARGLILGFLTGLLLLSSLPAPAAAQTPTQPAITVTAEVQPSAGPIPYDGATAIEIRVRTTCHQGSVAVEGIPVHFALHNPHFHADLQPTTIDVHFGTLECLYATAHQDRYLTATLHPDHNAPGLTDIPLLLTATYLGKEHALAEWTQQVALHEEWHVRLDGMNRDVQPRSSSHGTLVIRNQGNTPIRVHSIIIDPPTQGTLRDMEPLRVSTTGQNRASTLLQYHAIEPGPETIRLRLVGTTLSDTNHPLNAQYLQIIFDVREPYAHRFMEEPVVSSFFHYLAILGALGVVAFLWRRGRKISLVVSDDPDDPEPADPRPHEALFEVVAPTQDASPYLYGERYSIKRARSSR